MIESINIAGVATYGADRVPLGNLRKLDAARTESEQVSFQWLGTQ